MIWSRCLVVGLSLFALQFDNAAEAQQYRGDEANGESLYPPLSYDGRFVGFFSKADNLVKNDTNGVGDVFVHDAQQNSTELVSVSSGGEIGNGESTWPTISGNGRFVVFTSRASNLVKDDRNEAGDVFIHDRQSNTTERISVSSSGKEANGNSYTYFPSVSYDGRFIAFLSIASNLVLDDTNNDWDVFVHDRDKKTTKRVSIGTDGEDGNGPSLHAVISGDGQMIAFNSRASNLVADDTNNADDVFLYDSTAGKITRISVGADRIESNGDSDRAAISYKGRRIAFSSVATNLVRGDQNDAEDVFVYDNRTGEIVMISIGTNGTQMQLSDVDLCCLLSLVCCLVDTILDRKSVMSPDGNTVVFRSDAANLVSADFNGRQDIFVHNIAAKTTERVSVSSERAESNGTSVHHGVSFDGRFIAFSSEASNLVDNDNNGVSDIFLHDRATGITKRVSVPSN